MKRLKIIALFLGALLLGGGGTALGLVYMTSPNATRYNQLKTDEFSVEYPKWLRVPGGDVAVENSALRSRIEIKTQSNKGLSAELWQNSVVKAFESEGFTKKSETTVGGITTYAFEKSDKGKTYKLTAKAFLTENKLVVVSTLSEAAFADKTKDIFGHVVNSIKIIKPARAAAVSGTIVKKLNDTTVLAYTDKGERVVLILSGETEYFVGEKKAAGDSIAPDRTFAADGEIKDNGVAVKSIIITGGVE